MNDFDRCNKVTGTYWLKCPIEDINIRLKIKPHEGTISLPRFEDYTEPNPASILENRVEEYSFKWQQKVFSLWETQRYSDVHNCLTDTEIHYNEMINNSNHESCKVFSYIHEDCFLSLPTDEIEKKDPIFNLNTCFNKLGLEESVGKLVGVGSMSHLLRSDEDISVNKQWTAMHIVYDNSEYNEDNHLLLKQEAILLSLYHNVDQNYLMVLPDVNNLNLNPYDIEATNGVYCGYHYGIELIFGPGEDGGELGRVLNKLSSRWKKRHKQLINFALPPLGRTQYFITLEVLDAGGFEMDDMYIVVDVKVPEEISCSNTLHQKSHISKSIVNENGHKSWKFGHLMEFTMEIDSSIDPSPIRIFFEAISTDWWGRHRTEGYSYLSLRLDPGVCERRLSCSRPEEKDRMKANNRRFFVGGCHLIKDLDILAKPQVQGGNFNFTSTGSVRIRWNIVKQERPTVAIPGVTEGLIAGLGRSSTSVLQGAEAAIRHYRRAKAKLVAATKDLV